MKNFIVEAKASPLGRKTNKSESKTIFTPLYLITTGVLAFFGAFFLVRRRQADTDTSRRPNERTKSVERMSLSLY